MTATSRLDIGGSLCSTIEMQGFSYSSILFLKEKSFVLVVTMVNVCISYVVRVHTCCHILSESMWDANVIMYILIQNCTAAAAFLAAVAALLLRLVI